MICRHGYVASLAVLVACTHESPFTTTIATYGPFQTGNDVQLTLNVDQDYWPTWTQDGKGILYAYVDRAFPLHRCLGLLPAAGGTRLWQLCDNRAIRVDTASGYEAFALDSTGRLLVAEGVAPANVFGGGALPTTTLWVADSATPYQRTTLLTLPAVVGPFTATWLADLAWTGPNSFIALAQQFGTAQVGSRTDSLFSDAGEIVIGNIANGRATLAVIPGTDSATSYSLANNGATIVFTVHHDLRLFTVPTTGGTVTPMRITRTVPDTAATIHAELAGVTCRGTDCIVAEDSILVTDTYMTYLPNGDFGQGFLAYRAVGDTMRLESVNLSTGATQVVRAGRSVFAVPKLSPVSNDIVVEIGGLGHLESAGSASSDLYLLKGLFP